MKQAFARLYILLAILLCGGSFAWADEVTFTLGNDANKYDITSNNGGANSNISITMTSGVSYNQVPTANSWFNGYNYHRAKGTIKVTPTNATITSIVLNCTKDNACTWSSSFGNSPKTDASNTIVTWTGTTSNDIILTNEGTAKSATRESHISSITVTYDITTTALRPINASINAYGYATFSCEYETKVPDGVTAYTGAVDENAKTITWNAVADGIIPMREGVLLKGTPSQTVTLAESRTCKEKIAGNHLKPNLTPCTKNELGNYIYVLSGENIMRLSDTGTLKANRAYFSLSKYITEATGESTASLRMIWNEGAATVIDITNTKTDKNTYYNLNGQRVSPSFNGKTGIVIINGKKVLMK